LEREKKVEIKKTKLSVERKKRRKKRKMRVLSLWWKRWVAPATTTAMAMRTKVWA